MDESLLDALFSKVVSRNNTSFTKELFDTLKEIQTSKDDYLRYHQRLATEYVAHYPHVRGMLMYHKMGSGKTILGVAVCEALLAKGKRNVMFISAKSLHKNFRESIKKYWKMRDPDHFIEEGSSDAYINEHYSFVSANASNFMDQVARAAQGDNLQEQVEDIGEMLKTREDRKRKKPSEMFINLSGYIIVWDEFHNFLNSLANGSKNAVAFYDLCMNTPDLKIIGLTGTPIINDPYEIALGFNLFAGPILHHGRARTLFGEDYVDFAKNFVSNPDALNLDSKAMRAHIKNKDKFQDRILGMVSYYGADTLELQEKFPLEYSLVVQKVHMSGKQFGAYSAARDREIEEGKRGIFKEQKQRIKKPSLGSTASFRPRTRQLSNVYYPPNASTLTRNSAGKIEYEKFPDKLIPENLQLPQLNDWSPKMVSILKNIALHTPVLKQFKPSAAELKKIVELRQKANASKQSKKKPKTWKPGIGPGLVYSQFIDSGVGFLGKVLKENGFTEITDPAAARSSKVNFAIISGEVDPEVRDAIKELYNSPDNKDGSVIMLLLVTSTGAEGLDLKRGRHVHIMEPFWYWGRIRQVITRLVRMMSHADLPLEEQNVQPYIYLAEYPSHSGKPEELKKLKELELTTDMVLFAKALANNSLNQDFLVAIQEASIDCSIHYDKDKNCKFCSPTGRTLWYANLDKDIEEPSPCEPFETKSVKARKIKLKTDGETVEFMYTTDPIRIYENRPDLGGYVEINSEHEYWDDLVKAIKKQSKKL